MAATLNIITGVPRAITLPGCSVSFSRAINAHRAALQAFVEAPSDLEYTDRPRFTALENAYMWTGEWLRSLTPDSWHEMIELMKVSVQGDAQFLDEEVIGHVRRLADRQTGAS